MNRILAFLLLLCGLPPNAAAQPGDLFNKKTYIFRFNEQVRPPRLTVEPPPDQEDRKWGKWDIQRERVGGGWEITAEQDYPVGNECVFVFYEKSINESMRIRTGYGLVDIPFLPGDYRIPSEYNLLFNIQEVNSRLINRNISDFEIAANGNPPALESLSLSPILPHYVVDARAVPNTKNLLAASDTSLFLINGKTGKHSVLPFRINKDLRHIVGVAPASKRRFYVWLQERPSDSRIVFVSDDQGGTWRRDSLLSGMKMEDIRFADANTGYALGGFNEERTAFFRTEDGGDTWRLVYRIKGKGYKIKDLNMPNEIIVEGGYSGRRKYFRSTDGGESWGNHLPPDINNHAGDLFLAEGKLQRFQADGMRMLLDFGQEGSAPQLIAKQESGDFLICMEAHYAMYNRSKEHRLSLLHSSDSGDSWRYIPLSLPRHRIPPQLHHKHEPLFFSGNDGWCFIIDYRLYFIRI